MSGWLFADCFTRAFIALRATEKVRLHSIALEETPPTTSNLAEPRKDGVAIASYWLGVLSLALSIIGVGLLLSIPAILLGHLATYRIRKSRGALSGREKAKAGLVMGYIAFGLLLCGLALKRSVTNSRMHANEMCALEQTRRAEKAAANYQKQFGSYAPRLEDFAKYEEGWTPANSPEPVFIGHGCGYRFFYQAKTSSSRVENTFFIRAIPVESGNEGAREICGDQTGAIRVARKGTACGTASEEVREADEYGRLKLPD